MKKYIYILLLGFVSTTMYNCKQNEEARRPISHKTGSFMKQSIERNKKLVATEEQLIQNIMKKESSVKFFASKKGYWYSYIIKNENDTLTPKKGDIANFEYEIKDIHGKLIYSAQELLPQTYAVDQQAYITGLMDGIKLMHKNEKIQFLFPSHMAYGYHGDDKKIGPKQPIICTVYLKDFKKPVLQTKNPTKITKTKIAPTKKDSI